MERLGKRFLLGIVLGALVGLLIWGMVSLIEIWEGPLLPAITGIGVGLLTSIITWLVPKPRETVQYLVAFWEALKMSPKERVLYRALSEVHREQQQQPHKHIYLMEDEVDVGPWVEQSPNTVRVNFYLVSCLLEETPIEACEVVLVYGGYEVPQGFPIRQITNLLKLTSGNKHSHVVSVTDMKMQEFVEAVRNKTSDHNFSLEVYLRIGGKLEKVQHRE